MSQIKTPDGASHREDRYGGPYPQAGSEPTARFDAVRSRRGLMSLVLGTGLSLLAAAFVAGGAVGFWKDQLDRDDAGFVPFGTTQLQTEQYAIVADLKGDGPSWLYGPGVLGETRVRATSEADEPLFIGVGRTADVFGYLHGVGYASVYSFDISADTTHPGEAPSGPPSDEPIWATSTEGSGRQTLLWKPRSGEWSVVFMNADAGAKVDVRGDASAELPPLPWLAGGLLVLGTIAGAGGAWVLRSGRGGAGIDERK